MRRASRGPVISYTIATKHTLEVRGNAHDVWSVLEKAGCPRQYSYLPPSGGSKCWLAPAHAETAIIRAARAMNGVAAPEVTALWETAA